MTNLRRTTRLKRIFESQDTELLPFGVMPIHAQMAEAAGFNAFYISGGLMAWWYGMPDAGLVTRTEIVDLARRVVQSVEIPVYCDADTGYGGIHNVRKTVQEFVAAGVAGIHIEDQREPKKTGGYAGVEIVSDEEALGRLRAACEARDELDPDFVITARTDAYGAAGGGLEEALRRGKLYKQESGVDVIFYEGIRSWEECQWLLAETPGPAYVIAGRQAGRTPPVAELSAMGQAINIVQFAVPALPETWKMLLQVKNTGGLDPVDEYIENLFAEQDSEQFIGKGDAFVKPTYQQVRELEERFLPMNQQRDYEGTAPA
jgi:methylisocitrate lyase